MRQVVDEALVQNPAALTSTNLRKHLATMSQVLRFDEYDVNMLARFMGHNMDVHRDFYQLPVEVIDRCKVAQVLIQINSGKRNLSDFSDRSYRDENDAVTISDMVGDEEPNGNFLYSK